MQQTNPLLLKSYALLAVLESALAFYLLSTIPSDAGNAVLAGYSASRLLLLAGAAIPFLVFGLIFAALNISPARLDQAVSIVEDVLGKKWKRLAVSATSSLLTFAGITLFLIPTSRLGDYAPAVERLAPLVYLGGVLGAQTLLGQFLWRGEKFHIQNLREWKPVFIVAGILLAFAAVTAVWVAWSGIGMEPEIYGWHTPGTPISFAQIFIALFVSCLFMFFRKRLVGKNFTQTRSCHLFILWLAAFLIWQAEPMRKNSYFTPAPTPPNFEYYPYSDAAFYDTLSQSILIGQGRSLDSDPASRFIFSS